MPDPGLGDVIELTRELCLIPSVTGNEADVVAVIQERLKSLGCDVRLQRVGDPAGRANLLATVGGRAPDVLLTTHIDTVPPYIAPVVEGEWITGRGVIDAKGIAAAMLVAFARLVKAGEERVGVLFVVGEETNSDGAKAAAAQGFVPPVQYFINGEPTDGLLCRAMKGVLAFSLHAKGEAGHSAYPEHFHSATHQLITDLHALQNEAWPVTELGPTTLNVGTIQGGVAPNVVAAEASARIMMRPTSDPDAILDRVRALLSKDTELRLSTKAPPVSLHTVEGEATCVVAFGSDVPHLSPILQPRRGAPLLVGPGSILDAHTDHERVKLQDLKDAASAYERLSLSLLQTLPSPSSSRTP